ncbi:hypothetical protein V1478_000243, partial [Vespula squamosa]
MLNVRNYGTKVSGIKNRKRKNRRFAERYCGGFIVEEQLTRSIALEIRDLNESINQQIWWYYHRDPNAGGYHAKRSKKQTPKDGKDKSRMDHAMSPTEDLSSARLPHYRFLTTLYKIVKAKINQKYAACEGNKIIRQKS